MLKVKYRVTEITTYEGIIELTGEEFDKLDKYDTEVLGETLLVKTGRRTAIDTLIHDVEKFEISEIQD